MKKKLLLEFGPMKGRVGSNRETENRNVKLIIIFFFQCKYINLYKKCIPYIYKCIHLEHRSYKFKTLLLTHLRLLNRPT